MRLSYKGYFPFRYQRDVPDERDLRFASTNNLTERASAGFFSDEPFFFQLQNHMVYCQRCDPKESLQISLCRGSSVHHSIVVDKCQILALFFCEILRHPDRHSPVFPQKLDSAKLSCQ